MVLARLTDDARNVLEQVEGKTGKPVEVLPDPELQTYATIKTARGYVHAHILAYNPNKPGVDYHVAYQCGFVLRLFDNPPEERFEFAGNRAGREAVRGLLTQKDGIAKRFRLPKATVEQMVDQFLNGLLTQVRSFPIGMRIDRWIRESYPDLSDAQEASIDRQQRENARALDPQVRQMSPLPIFSSNASMNAAYALFCDRLLGMSQYVVPYRSVGFEERGRDLLGIWDATPADARHDRELVDAWGENLDISSWYQWVPFGEGVR